MSNRRTAKSHTSTSCGNKTDDNTYNRENITDSFQGEASVEPKINPTGNIQQNLLHIPESSFSEIFTGQRPKFFVELQHQVSVF